MEGQIIQCVQCGLSYSTDDNQDGACSFHRLADAACCVPEASGGSNRPGPVTISNESHSIGTSHAHGRPAPCQRAAHRAAHHHDYGYAAFFERARAVLTAADTVDAWISATDGNLEDSRRSQAAVVGRLKRWKAGASPPGGPPLLLVALGRIGRSDFCDLNAPGAVFFCTFTPDEIRAAAAFAAVSSGADQVSLLHRVTIDENRKSNENGNEIDNENQTFESLAQADWILRGRDVAGVRVSVKAATSPVPLVQQIWFDPVTIVASTPAETLSRSHIVFNPETPYLLPSPHIVGTALPESAPRAVRTDFRSSPAGAAIRLLAASKPPLRANISTVSTDVDRFHGTVAAYNRSNEPVVIATIEAAFRLLGSSIYDPMRDLELIGTRLPSTIPPKSSIDFAFVAHVPRIPLDRALNLQWWNRAVVARKRPLRIRLTLRDMDDHATSLVLEYIFTQPTLERASSTDFGFVHLDDLERCERYCVHISPSKQGVVDVCGTVLDEAALHRLVHRARKTNTTEINLNISRIWGDGACECHTWALIDLSCSRVYAFKVLLQQGNLASVKTRASLVYTACPDYGDATESRPIQYAQETNVFPSLANETLDQVVWEDSLDDPDEDDANGTLSSVVLPATGSDPAGLANGTSSSFNMSGFGSGVDHNSSGVSASYVPSETNPLQRLGTSHALEARLASLDANIGRAATAIEQLVKVLRTHFDIKEPSSS